MTDHTELRKLAEAATPGPWRWELNEKARAVNLSGGIPTFDKTVIDFERWGMQHATPRFNDKIDGGEFNIMEPARKYAEKVIGREHHASWFKTVAHPDAEFIAASNPSQVIALLDEIKALKTADQHRHDAYVARDWQNAQLRDELAQLRAELQQCRKDAARYQYVRNTTKAIRNDDGSGRYEVTPDEFDAAVDRGMISVATETKEKKE